MERSMFLRLLSTATVCVLSLTALAANANANTADDSKVAGTWKWSWTDQNGTTRNRELKIRSEGGKLSAVVVREEGKETAVKEIQLDGDSIKISSSAERNGQTIEIQYEGKVKGDTIEGTSRFGDRTRPWTARREPWIDLIKGATLAEAGWKIRPDRAEDEKHKSSWTLKDGVLTNKPAGGKGGIDIVHEKSLKDFELHVEFNVPAHSNSGVYLRGLYEVQVEDTCGRPVKDTICGSVYGQQAVCENAAKPAGEWQTFDITLKDNKVTVVHNGKKVIDAFEVKGVTGGALPPAQVKHGEPGPLMLQGDHGEVSFRNIRIRPIATAL